MNHKSAHRSRTALVALWMSCLVITASSAAWAGDGLDNSQAVAMVETAGVRFDLQAKTGTGVPAASGPAYAPTGAETAPAAPLGRSVSGLAAIALIGLPLFVLAGLNSRKRRRA